MVVVTADLGNKYILPSTSPATYQRFHDFPFLRRVLYFYTLHLTLPVKLEVCSPKTLPSTTTSNGNSQSSLTGPPAASRQLVVPSLTLHSFLPLPRFPRHRLSLHFPLFAVLLGPFSGLTCLLSVLHFSTPWASTLASSHSPRHSGSIYTRVTPRLSNAVRKGMLCRKTNLYKCLWAPVFSLCYDEATNL